MVEIKNSAHEIMDDVAPRRQLAKDIHLQLVELRHHPRCEAAIIHPVRRVRLGHCQVRQFHLVKAAILHRPEDISPGPVQRVGRLIALRQPVTKGGEVGRSIGNGRVVAAIFIVRLPADDSRMGAEAAGHQTGDAGTFAPVSLMREAVMPARAETARPPVLSGGNHVGHLVDKPLWRRRRRRAQHGPDAVFMQQVQNVLHPVEIDDAGFGFDHAPGKLSHPDKVDAEFAHLGNIGRPVGPVPVLGEIADTELAARHCVHPGSQSRCATSISSVMARIWRTSSSAAVCGSNMAAWKICSRFSSVSAATVSS